MTDTLNPAFYNKRPKELVVIPLPRLLITPPQIAIILHRLEDSSGFF